LNGQIKVSVFSDDIGGFSSKLKGNSLKVLFMGISHDIVTDLGRASEGNFIDSWMPGKVSSNVSKTRYDVDNTSWEASFLNELSHSQSGKRGLLSCFHDDSASSSKSWGELPGLHEQWEVPRDNLSDYSDRFSSS